VMITKSKLVITVLAILLVTVLVFMSMATMAQTITQVILNLLNGQQYFGAPHIYQGDNMGSPTGSWPSYSGPSLAILYWDEGGIKSNQPVLELTPNQQYTAGAMFWSETYSGGVVRITIIGTYNIGTLYYIGDGFVIYLFLTPTKWGISPNYNYSIPYTSTTENELYYTLGYPSLTEGDVILPQSSTPYIVVQWNPIWHTEFSYPGTTGQWNVWIVSNPNGNNPSIAPSPSPNLGSGSAGWGGIGTGYFKPHPGNWINITVTYDPSTNILSGVVYDMNTSQTASFTLNLTGYYKPPSIGNYVFGIGAATGHHDANWALLYVAESPSSLIPTIIVQLLASVMHPWVIIVIIVIIIALIAAGISRRRKRRYRYYRYYYRY